jgi:hypothetical protein
MRGWLGGLLVSVWLGLGCGAAGADPATNDAGGQARDGSGGFGGFGGSDGAVPNLDGSAGHDGSAGSGDSGAHDAAALDGGADSGPGPWVEPTEVIDLNALPGSVPTVGIEIAPADQALLEADPYTAADVPGVFIDEDGTRYEMSNLNFRGAYALRSLIDGGGPQRNWKLKVPSAQPYRGRREWNFNYDPRPRHKLAYDLMHFAGVKVVSARHVLFTVNGVAHGLYLEYEDPDSKGWLSDKFADDTGDLYKAATDLPGLPRYFATTEYLGDLDASYEQHYVKKTNHKALPVSYARLRAFLDGLNNTPDAEFQAWIAQAFDVPKFIQYLVVANFISHWDSLPQRPKNYWLYEIPAAQHFVFIPWDLDGTFQVSTNGLNPMGTTASVFYQFDDYQDYDAEDGEGMNRPLVRRIMALPAYRDAYVAAYREALTTYLDADYLVARVTALEQLLLNAASADDDSRVTSAANDMRQFIQAKHANVSAELDAL